MKRKIGMIISKSIREGKWVLISYKNAKGEETTFWCNVLDIDADTKKLNIDIFNIFKGNKVLKDTWINYEGIINAQVLDGTFANYNATLNKKIEDNPSDYAWLSYNEFNDKILEYYVECKKLDVNPFQSDFDNIEGIDLDVLSSNKVVKLNDKQFEQIAKIIYKNTLDENSNKYSTLAINRVSILMRSKLYVVGYYPLYLDIDKKSLRITSSLNINKSFLIDGTTYNLASYLNSDPASFQNMLNENIEEGIECLRESLRHYELIDEMPYLMLISREITLDYGTAFDEIINKHRHNELSLPLKAFFGNLSVRNRGRSEPDIVVIDNHVNIDQVRVVYNAMKQPVTYVMGPPGTGKTVTIVNVVLSAFLNEKTVLICSNNNKPVNDLIKKLSFKFNDKDVIFPIIRLGNREETLKSLTGLKDIIKIAEGINVFDDVMKSIVSKTSDKYVKLKGLIEAYESRKNASDNFEECKKFYNYAEKNENTSKKLLEALHQKVLELRAEVDSKPYISNEDVLKNVVSAKDNKEFMRYLYYNSFKYLKRLTHPTNRDLLEILDLQDDEMVTGFNRYIKEPDNLKKFIRCFPFVATTNISALKLGKVDPYFDLCIMDEGGQCDVAGGLIPISKAKSLLLVGDTNQLSPVITLDDTINSQLMDRYEIDLNYNYCNNSILKLMMNVDDVSPQIMLSYHYRCGKNIINYSNHRYYSDELNIQTAIGNNQLEFLSVHNNIMSEDRNSYLEEAVQIVDYIKRNQLKGENTSIVTPFRNQAYLINTLLEKEDSDVKAGTIHTVQGAENKNIIFAPGIGIKSSKKTYEWLANNKELINVALTRAQEKFIIIGDYDAIKTFAGKNDDDISSLCEYVKSKGTMKVAKSKVNSIQIGLSNNSKFENDFYSMMVQFCSVHKRFEIKRNVKVSSVLTRTKQDYLTRYFKNAEFDAVLYDVRIFGGKVPAIVFELNGGEHYISKSVSEANDKKKMEICNEYGIKYVSIPNSYAKSYMTIRALIFSINGIQDEDLTLFD